jgi:2-phosphosulfolactate phosphatase
VSYFDQAEFDIRCEWGEQGINQLAPGSDAVIIVDLLSFSTSVDIAVSNGAWVYPYRGQRELAQAYADSLGALLADFNRQTQSGFSLAPSSLLQIPAGTRLVLPSPNGSTLTLATGNIPTFAACLRNFKAVAAVTQMGKRISVIPAGERWRDGSLRPALEDLLGAGALIDLLPGKRSPEAETAVAVYHHYAGTLLDTLQHCSSGKELIGRGFGEDVELATQANSSDAVPQLVDGAYRNRGSTSQNQI